MNVQRPTSNIEHRSVNQEERRSALRRSWPQAASMSWPFSIRRVTWVPASVEGFAETAAVGLGRAFPVESVDGVVGDQVHLGAQAAGVAGEQLGLVERVVDALDQDVFQGEFLFLEAIPVVERGEQVGQRVALVDRHDLVADLVGGAVERDREPDLLRVLGELADFGDQSGGRDGEVARSDVEPPGGGEDGDRGEHGVEIGERFAHAHEDQVIDPLSGEHLGGQHLAGDFPGVEVAGEAGQAGGAELATVGATDLGGDAQGATVRG